MLLNLLMQTDPDAVDAGLWLGWFIAYLMVFVCLLIHYIEKLRSLKVVYCYKEKEVDGKPVISTEITLLGEFKKVGYDDARKLHTITFRHNLKSLTIYSKYSWDQYLATFKRKIWFLWFYDMDAYIFKKEIPDGKIVKLDFTSAWKVYLGFKWIYEFSLRGIAVSFTITALIVSAFSGGDFIVFLIAGGIGVIISLVNTVLYERGVINPKKKTEKITYEWHMFPSEPHKKIIDVYKIKGEKQVVVEKADKPEMGWEKFEEEIEGFEEVQKILNSDLYKKIKYKKIKEREEDRTLSEMVKAKHSALYQMRYLYNEIVKAQETNLKLQRDNQNLYNQLGYLKSTEDRRRNEFVMNFLQEQQKNSDNFKDIFQKLSGDLQFGIKWDKIASRVLKEVEEKRKDDRFDKLNLISQILFKIVEKLVQLKNGDTLLDISSLMKKMDIKENDFLDIEKTAK